MIQDTIMNPWILHSFLLEVLNKNRQLSAYILLISYGLRWTGFLETFDPKSYCVHRVNTAYFCHIRFLLP